MTLEEALARARQVSREAIRLDCKRVRSPELAQLLLYLGEHLFDKDLSLSELRRRRDFPSAAWSAFESELRLEPKPYTVDKKLLGAAWLLRRTDVDILYVADFAGYATTGALDRAFPKWAGCLPSQYRRAAQRGAVIEVEVDELETDLFWWKALFRLLSLEQANRLFARLAERYPFLEPGRRVPEKPWRFHLAGFAKADLVFETLWRAARRLPPELGLKMLVERIELDVAADFFHFLCRKSLEVGRGEPERGVEVMATALGFLRASAKQLGSGFPALEALALARLANARRLASDVGSARRDLAEAHRVWKAVEEKDDLIEAEVVSYQATLHLSQGELGASRELLDRAIGLFEGKPHCRLLAQCLIQRATVLGYAGDPADALPDLDSALEVLADQAEPRLKLLVNSNLATARALAGRFDEAKLNLAQGLERCAELGDRVLHQHLCWAQGLIRHGRGELDAAAAAYENAMRGFAAVGQPGYVAMASLELALVRDEQGRFEDAAALAAAAIPVLEHFQHVSGVTAALRMLTEALAGQEVPRKVLEEVRQRLHALWRDPTADLAAVKARSRAGDAPALAW